MDTLANELIELDGQYQTMASDLKKEGKTLKFAMMSSGFGIWQNAYGFEVYPVVLSRYGVLPDAAQLAAVKEHLAEDGVKYIVYEPNMSDAMKAVFSTLEEQMGLTRIELSNLSSLSTTQMQDGKDYLSVMKENLLVLETVEPDDIEE
jgi:ABC-type Zn uptake system ZnuABC Zn-binding protein ZnuA